MTDAVASTVSIICMHLSWPSWLHKSGNVPSPSLHKYLLAHVSLRLCSEGNLGGKTPGSHNVPCVLGVSFVNLDHLPGTNDVPEVPLGNTAVSIAICPCSTRVKARRWSGVGVPKCSVRVTSVVPSRYCPRIRPST